MYLRGVRKGASPDLHFYFSAAPKEPPGSFPQQGAGSYSGTTPDGCRLIYLIGYFKSKKMPEKKEGEQ